MKKTKKEYLNSNRILFIDDMKSSHHQFKYVIDRYNNEHNTDLKIDCFFSVSELIMKKSDAYICGFFDWNLGSNDLNEMGDKAITNTNDSCFHKCVLTRMYDDINIYEYCKKNGLWLLTKTNKNDEFYEKVKSYLNNLLRWLKDEKQ